VSKSAPARDLINNNSSHRAKPQSMIKKFDRIALVSHNYNKNKKGEPWDYSAEFDQINTICDKNGCDTILYALYTWDQGAARARRVPYPFKELKNVNHIILESGNLSINNNSPKFMDDLTVEIWDRADELPSEILQCFSTTSQCTQSRGQYLLNNLDNRIINNGLVLICGETNLVSWSKAENRIQDPLNINSRLSEMDISLIFNPVHDYMTWKMWRKRKYLSLGNRTVISVWNEGSRCDSPNGPWMVCHDGLQRTDVVKELHVNGGICKSRPDLRIGILDIADI